MARQHRIWPLALLLGAGLLVSACGAGSGAQADTSPSPLAAASTGAAGESSPSPSEDGVSELIEQALAAREASDAAEFAALVTAAGAACADPDAARRLGEVSAIAGRWAAALQFSRPKAQAITENQLAQVDWDALVSACAAP